LWTLADFIENPAEPLQLVLDDLNPRAPHRITDLPRLAPLGGFGAFLQDLRNRGMQPVLMGDFPTDRPSDADSLRTDPQLARQQAR
jgi:hypothetical protein